MRKIFVLFFIMIVIIGCDQKDKMGGKGYYKDSTLTTLNGSLIDSTKLYFPERYFINDKWAELYFKDTNETYLRSDWLQYYSFNLKYFKAPVLYNYYLGHEMYRFLWLRFSQKPVLITLTKADRLIIINTKILNARPQQYTAIYNANGKNQYDRYIIADKCIDSLWKEYPYADSIVPPINNIKFSIDTTYEIAEDDWKFFLKLIDLCSFWEQEPLIGWGGCDGDQWVLEGQTYDKYHFVSRWEPEGHFKHCCEYLIALSKLDLNKMKISPNN